MKKIILVFSFIFCMIFTQNSFAEVNKKEGKSQELLLEEAFLRSMSEEILKAIEEYYGETWLYFLPSITNVTKSEAEGTFDVTVQIVTYQRAIMPPYGLDIITFRIPGNKIIKFEHKEIRGEDLPVDKFK